MAREQQVKRNIIVILLFFHLVPLYSLDSSFGIGLGFLGFGFNYDAKHTNGAFCGRVLDFIYQSEIGLGITASPFTFSIDLKDSTNYSLTFVNMSFFYNFLKESGGRFVLGPSVSIQAVDYNNSGFLEFRAGLTFHLRDNTNKFFNNDWLLIEAGYKYNKTSSNGFFAHIGFNPIAFLYFIGYAITSPPADANHWYDPDRHSARNRLLVDKLNSD